MHVVIAYDSTPPGPVGGLIRFLRRDVLGLGLRCEAEDCVGFDDLPARLARGPADLVLVLLGEEAGPALAATRGVARWRTPVLGIDPSSDPVRLLRAIRGGMRECLGAQRFRDELLAAIESLRESGEVPYRRGRALAVVAASGGSGTTTIASGLAFAMAARRGAGADGVALAELGRGSPALALALDLSPRHSIADLFERGDRSDSALLRRALVGHAGGVSILAHPPDALEGPRPEPASVRGLVVLFKALFRETVFDLGHAPDEAGWEALRQADATVLVTRLDVPSLRRTRSYLGHLEGRGIAPGSIVLTANRYGQRGQLAWGLASEALGRPIDAWLPDAPAAVNRALNQGLPLVGGQRSAIARRLGRLADRLAISSPRSGVAG